MRILIEICLTVCEWVQEMSIQRSARKAAREFEKKTFLTFLSQGAVGGVLGFFVLIAYSVIANPSGYNFILLVGLPIYSFGGAAYGAVAGVFIWLLEASFNRLRFADRVNPPANPGGAGTAFLNRTLRFVARTITGMLVMPSLMFAFYYLVDKRDLEQLSYSRWLGFSCTMGLLVALTTGSSIGPCRTIIFGAEGRRARRNFGSWLSIPVGFLLRALSIFGLLEALMTLALWISNGRVGWLWFPTREHLPTIILVVLYFAISTYFSFRSPRKVFLLPAAIVLNLPLAALIVNLRRIGTVDSNILAYLLVGFICLWSVYVLGRLIAPESARRVVNSWSGTADVRKVSPRGACQVQL
jgi:hypothetical protein